MQTRKPRLISIEPKGVMCKECKFSFGVDIKHNRYYCIPPEDVGRCWLYHGEHSCGKGEHK